MISINNSHNKGASLVSLIFLLLFSSVTNGQDFYKTPEKISLQDGYTFVFIGNSITHQCAYTQYVENYFFTRYPDKKINFVNAGISGDLAADVLIRLQDDVLARKPDYATILIGMNDGKYVNWDDDIFSTYKKDMTKLVKTLEREGIKPILLTPTIFDTQQALKGENWVDRSEIPNMHYNATLAHFGAWCLETATLNGYGYADLHTELTYFTRKVRQTDPDFTFVPDAVHPESDGQLIMALALLKGIGAEKLVSEVVIDKNKEGIWTYKAENGIITDSEREKISFNFQANALPWVVPDEASMAYDLTDAGSLMSKEVVRVLGLPYGQYELLIEETVVGEYSHLELALGVELQENSRTPQYQQALQIAKINQERNDEYVAPTRDNWLLRKELWQVKNGIEIDEDEEEEELEGEAETDPEELIFIEAHEMGFDKYLSGKFQERNKMLEAQSKKLVEKIYSINQPQKLHYEIRLKQ